MGLYSRHQLYVQQAVQFVYHMFALGIQLTMKASGKWLRHLQPYFEKFLLLIRMHVPRVILHS